MFPSYHYTKRILGIFILSIICATSFANPIPKYPFPLNLLSPQIGFYDITSGSPYTSASQVQLIAWDYNAAGGYITPGFILEVQGDAYSTQENYLYIYEENQIVYYSPALYNNLINRIIGQYLTPHLQWDFSWCDCIPNGIFPYKVSNNADGNINAQGTFDCNSGTSCSEISLGNITGIATFSGDGVTNYENGTGYFDAKAAGVGKHTITYCWNNEAGFSGCSSQTIEVIAPVAEAGKNASICLGESVKLGGTPTASSGAGNYTYRWTPSANLDNPTIANPIVKPSKTTIYYLTVTDNYGNGFSTIDSITIKVNPLPSINLGSDTTICEGSSLVLDAGSNFSSYLWQDNSTKSTLVATQQGKYKVLVTNEFGCKSSDSLTMNVSKMLNLDLGKDTSFCKGNSLIIKPKQTYSNYLWQNGSTQNNLVIDSTGIYSLKVWDSKGCSDIDSITIKINPLPSINLGTDTTICEGSSLVLDAGSNFLSYLWQDNSIKSTFVATQQGKYKVLVTNEFGCKSSDSLTMNVSKMLNLDLGKDTSFCKGNSLIIKPKQTYSNYLWQNGSTQNYLTIDSTGIYSLKVWDSEGCSDIDSIAIKVNPLPSINLGSDTTICEGSSLVLDAGSNFSSYLWQDNSIKSTLVATQQGKYKVLVTNEFGCKSSDSLTMNVSKMLNLDLGKDTSFCKGNSLIIKPKQTYSNYLWQNGSTQNYLTIDSTGIYSLKVWDSEGCSDIDSIAIKVNPLPNINLGSDTTICEGSSLVLEAGENNNQYLWNDNSTNSTLSISKQGLYKVIVTNSFQCKNSDSILVDVRKKPKINLGRDTSICSNQTIVFDAGAGFKSYLWNTGKQTQTIFVFNAGKYSVSVNDGFCSSFDEIELTVNNTPYVNISDTTVCEGDTVVFNAPNGYTYLWTPIPSTNQQIRLQKAGIYWLTITDKNNCYYADRFELKTNPLPTIDLGSDVEICENEIYTFNAQVQNSYLWNDNSVNQYLSTNKGGNYWVKVANQYQCFDSDTINLKINSLPKVSIGKDTTICEGDTVQLSTNQCFTTYFWNTNETTPKITVSKSGVYTLKVRDSNSCQNVDTVKVSVNLLPKVHLGNDTAICQGESVQLSTNQNFTTYFWNTNETTPKITVSKSGTYTLKVTDSNSCQNVDTVKVMVNPLPKVFIGNDTTICQGESVQLSTNQNFTNYFWSTNETTPKITVSKAGVYTLKVRDSNSCQNVDTVNVSVNLLPKVHLGNDTAICQGESVQLSTNQYFTTYFWNTNETTPKITVSKAGVYTLKVRDSNSCQNIDTVKVSVNLLPKVHLGNDTAICQGESVQLCVNQGFITYLWNTNETTPKITVSKAGVYTLKVTDSNSCQNIDTVKVSVNPLPQFDLGKDTTICEGNTILFSVSKPFKSYKWQNNSTLQTFEASQKGMYSVIVTDIYGCKSSDSIELSFYPNPVVELGEDKTICKGDSIDIQSDKSFKTYLWNTNQISPRITVSKAGLYLLKVSDANLCTAKDSIKIFYFADIQIDSIVKKDISCFGANDGKIKMYPEIYSFSIDKCKTFVDNKGYFVDLQVNTYQIIIKDKNQCKLQSEMITISEPQKFLLNIDNQVLKCFEDSIGTLQVFANGGISPYSFILNKDTLSDPKTVRFNNLKRGSYHLKGIDSNTCKVDTSVIIESPIKLEIKRVEHTDLDCYLADNGTISISVKGGTPDYKFSIDNGKIYTNSNIFEKLPSTMYYPIVRDNNGCQTTDNQVFISQPTPLKIDSIGSENATCPLFNNGKIQLKISGGTPDYQYFANGFKSSLENLDAGFYHLKIVDKNQCSIEDTIKVEAIIRDCLEIPTAFSPNGDGINDVWNLKNVEYFENVKVKIYDVSNRLVFESLGYKEAWNGTFNGSPLPVNSYFYLIWVGKNTKPISGYVSIVR